MFMRGTSGRVLRRQRAAQSPPSGCQPPPSALYRRTWSALTSALALATLSWVLSWRALGFEHDLEVDQAAAVALARQQRGVAGGLGGAAAGAPGARGRRAARPARPPRPSAPSAPRPGRPRGPGPAPPAARAPGRARAPPSNSGIDTPASSALTTDAPLVSAPSVSAFRPSEPLSRKLGKRARIGLRHAGQRRRHLVLGGAHVGPLAQRLGGNAQRQVVGGLRHRAGRGQHA